MITLYGIKNCDSVKKARNWLESHAIDYHFHDFRVEGLTQEKLKQWQTSVGWEVLLNKRSTNWRQLSQELRDNIHDASALSLMLENPTLIKRPVLEMSNGNMHVGFKPEKYTKIFS